MSLLVVGTVAFDAIETPFGKRDKIIGGSATYIGLSASNFYRPIHIVSVVGSDFPKSTLAAFNKRGIKTDGVQIKKGEKSFFWAGKYHMDMNSRDTLRTDLNVLADFNPILPEKIRKPEMVMLGNIDPALQIRVIEQLKARPKLIAMDTMNFWMDIARPALDRVLTMVDVLIVNDEEARQLTGEHAIVKAAKAIRKFGPKTVIIKKGEHGALLFQGELVFFAPAMPLEDVFDPTGAGDTFAGGFMGYLAQTGSLSFTNMKRAIVHGSAMASFCVEQFGPEKLLTLRKPELKKRLQQFKTLAHFQIKA